MKRKTRNELIKEDIDKAIQYPVHLVAIHFNDDHNLAFLIRAAACFGAKSVVGAKMLFSVKQLFATKNVL